MPETREEKLPFGHVMTQLSLDTVSADLSRDYSASFDVEDGYSIVLAAKHVTQFENVVQVLQ